MRLGGPAPLPAGDELVGITKGADGGLWAWGWRYGRHRTASALLERRTGSVWRILPSPAGGIDGVAALAGDDVWIAESTRHGGRLTHWDGRSWKRVAVFDHISTSEVDNLMLVLGRSDVWAAGCRVSGYYMDPKGRRHARTRPVVLRWNGVRRYPLTLPRLGPSILDAVPRIVRASSSLNVWVLGDYQQGKRVMVNGTARWRSVKGGQFLLHWNGVRWTRQAGPMHRLSTGSHDQILVADMGVSTDGELWCAGSRWGGPDNDSDMAVGSAVRLVGGRWQTMVSSQVTSLPADWTRSFRLSPISLTSSSDVWVAGVPGRSGGDLGLWRWNGTNWSATDLGVQSERCAIRGMLSVASDDVWIVLTRAQEPDQANVERRDSFFLHYDGATWQRVPAAP